MSLPNTGDDEIVLYGDMMIIARKVQNFSVVIANPCMDGSVMSMQTTSSENNLNK